MTDWSAFWIAFAVWIVADVWVFLSGYDGAFYTHETPHELRSQCIKLKLEKECNDG